MIAIVDYGMGNLHSVAKALQKRDIPAEITSSADTIAAADGVILPGVGAFGEASLNLRSRGLDKPILKHIEKGKPFFGICLGLHLLFEGSDESPKEPGLGLFKGRVVRFQTDLKVPHMGWNSVEKQKDIPMLTGINDGDYFYFVHSYYVAPEDPTVAATLTEYGEKFVSSVGVDNVFACQFHPEKSQDRGLTLIKNFGESI